MKYQKKLKVEVSGLIDETFIGYEDEVEKYLKQLKEKQMLLINVDDLKFYKKERPKFTYSMLHWVGNSTRYGILGDKYRNPCYQMRAFREKYKEEGLKISITTI